ncbi:MAG: YicC family protein [Muribaculaceae bacterium]|nr:YicC family protein [Muribaculaceae bacterium]
MLYSMTGFGKATAETDGVKITFEIKTLNSKQLDLTLRMPGAFRAREAAVRDIIGSALERGKIEASASMEQAAGAASVELDPDALAAYKAQIERTSEALGIPVPDNWFGLLLRMPDVYRAVAPADSSEAEWKAMTTALEGAAAACMAHRRAEGERLEAFFNERIDGIAALLAQVDAFEAERVPRIRARIEEGLAKLAGIDYDRGRLEQEMIFYIEKLDVNEEKQRLTQHLRYFRDTMAAPGLSHGKKLGFIAQEMGREINTLGSKSNHAEMQRLVVEMKDILEQIKEQVLNVL